MEEKITLDYGSGGAKTADLIESMLVPAFDNPALTQLGDGAVLEGSDFLVFSTDSFVVSPWKFPGGDIGKLSVCGTVNDICMAGGIPKYLSLSFLIEEGFAFSDLKEIVASIAREAEEAGVSVVTGDTKVVEAGKGDGLYINTAGIGFRRMIFPGKTGIQKGDAVLISGSAGNHGAAVMMARNGLIGTGSPLVSDCQPLHKITEAVFQTAEKYPEGSVRIMRDPTRGGAATTLNEFTDGMPFSIELQEDKIPVDETVRTACDLLGLDPLYCACEGRMLVICDPDCAEDMLNAMKSVPGGENAARIGTVTDELPGKVLLKTGIGGKRILNRLTGMQLPRIC